MPPLVDVDVKVILAPEQIIDDGVAISTDGNKTGLTTIVMAVEVAFGVLAQPESLTILTLTWSLFAKVIGVNSVAVALAVP